MSTALDWGTILTVFSKFKEIFIWINFTLAMLIFVPYMTLIILDVTIYIYRLTWEFTIGNIKSTKNRNINIKNDKNNKKRKKTNNPTISLTETKKGV